MARRPAAPDQNLARMGVGGFKRDTAHVFEEWHPKLTGTRGVRVFREMYDNDAVIGGAMWAAESLIRQSEWEFVVAKGNESSPAAKELADWANTLLGDMEQTWQSTISDILLMLPFGWSLCVDLFKVRRGYACDALGRPIPQLHSQHEDGLYGWRDISIRAQETLWEWDFDKETGKPIGMWQRATPYYQAAYIPVHRALLFRLKNNKGSPEGRALDPATPIPTPDGWRTMGALRAGDKIFDDQGKIRYVAARADWKNRPRYRVTFSDGGSIVADAEHQWHTRNFYERSRRMPGKIRTTAEIAASVKAKGGGHSNHSIAWAGAVDYPRQQLPLDPYYLGLWLGDGISANSSIACHVQDASHVQAAMTACGYVASVENNGPEGGLGRLVRVSALEKWDRTGPASLLTSMGLRNNKHIPEAYLRGDAEQRRALLAGLMDSDGHCDAWGRCEFVNTNRSLIDGTAELVRSLGHGATVRLRKRANGKDHKQNAWAVRFTPTESPFRLARKTAKIKPTRARAQHYIVSVEPLPPGDTVCIETDGPSHMFLAGQSMVPTHNSALRNAYRSWFFLKRIQEYEAIGVERDLAGLPVMQLPVGLMAATDAATVAVRNDYQDKIQKIRRDQLEGLCVPAELDQQGKPTGYKFGLVTSGGRRPIDVNEIIKRYESRIAISLFSEFLLLGQDKVGSFSMHSDKTALFAVALGAIMDVITEEFNRVAIPRLMRLNGFDQTLWPVMRHGDVEKEKAAEITHAFTELVQAGLIVPTDEDEAYARSLVDWPQRNPDDRVRMTPQQALGATPGQQAGAVQMELPLDGEGADPGMDGPDFWTADEVASKLGVSRAQVNGAIRRGQLPGVKIGNSYRVSRKDAERLWSGNRG